jgi:hypothetical protein
LRPISLCRHAVATTPVGPWQGSSRSPVSHGGGLPRWLAGSAPTLAFSRPAQRSLRLRPACSRDRLAVLSIEGFGDFVTSTAAPIATGWSESCRVGIAPTEDRRLFTAHQRIMQCIIGCSNPAGRVGRWRGSLGVAYLFPALSFAGASLAAPCPVSTSPPHRTGHAGFPHPALRRVNHRPAHGCPSPIAAVP